MNKPTTPLALQIPRITRRKVRLTNHQSSIINHQFSALILVAVVAALFVPLAMAQTPRTHTVKPGDTLYRIAVNNDTSVEELQRINELEDTTIHVGQQLLLEQGEGQLFIEAYGDETADAPLRADDAAAEQPQDVSPRAVDQPMDDAPPESGVDRTGASVTTVPTSEPTLPSDGQVEVVLNPVRSPDAFNVYAVQSEDDFATVGERLGIAPGILEALNPDIAQPLAAGTEIRLPIESSSLLYAVRDGDTVERIAAHFGSTPQALMEANALQSTTLRIGQRLRVPISAGDESAGAVSVDVAWDDSAAEGSPGGGSATRQTEDANVGAAVTGSARIYPDRYQGRLMASGKPYDAKRFTVSHPTLELGSVVLLTNEQTGRKTFAEVTDRPPSGTDYLLDVSTAVADVLGLGASGGEVTVQVTNN